MATAGQAVAGGLATCLVAWRYSDSATLAAIFGSVAMIFTAATAVGYLQGLERFGLITVLKVAEVVVKAGLGLGLVALGVGVSGAIAGFAVGAAVVAAVGFTVMAPDIRFVRSSLRDRTLWLDARGMLAIQAGAAVLASLDIVVASLLIADRAHLATYQAAQILARVPVFIGSSLSIVVFPRLVAKRADTWRTTATSSPCSPGSIRYRGHRHLPTSHPPPVPGRLRGRGRHPPPRRLGGSAWGSPTWSRPLPGLRVLLPCDRPAGEGTLLQAASAPPSARGRLRGHPRGRHRRRRGGRGVGPQRPGGPGPATPPASVGWLSARC